ALVGPDPSVGAVDAIAAEVAPQGVLPALRRLVRMDFLRPVWSGQDGEEVFQFRHVVVRDVVYCGLSREVRASLHERLGKWLTRNMESNAGTDAFIGYHLEQAYVLGQHRDRAGLVRRRSLGRQGAIALASGRHRELSETGVRERLSMLSRALKLLDDSDRARGELLADIGVDLEQLSDWDGARHHYTEAVRLATH